MGVYCSTNIHADIAHFLQEEDRLLERLPVCSICGNPIQQEDAVHFGDSLGWVCDECLSMLRETVD